jgi:hypothetical protein
MKYVMSWGLPFIQPQFTSLNLAPLQFTAFSMIPPHFKLRLIYHYSNPFPKIASFEYDNVLSSKLLFLFFVNYNSS